MIKQDRQVVVVAAGRGKKARVEAERRRAQLEAGQDTMVEGARGTVPRPRR